MKMWDLDTSSQKDRTPDFLTRWSHSHQKDYTRQYFIKATLKRRTAEINSLPLWSTVWRPDNRQLWARQTKRSGLTTGNVPWWKCYHFLWVAVDAETWNHSSRSPHLSIIIATSIATIIIIIIIITIRIRIMIVIRRIRIMNHSYLCSWSQPQSKAYNTPW